MTIKFYGNANCQACVMLKKDLSKKNIEFQYIDILENMENLKEYLKYRDTHIIFDEYKKINKLGIPLVVIEKDGHEELFTEHYKADFL